MQNYTSIGRSERREKGIHSKPLTFLLVELLILLLVVFFVSFSDINLVTLLTGLAALFYFMVSCVPRYIAMRKRQSNR